MLFESAFVLNEETATLSIALCALALERTSKDSSIVYSYSLMKDDANFDLYKIF